MKKSLALVLALIMVMGCMSFAAAEGGRTVTLNKQNLQCLHGICDVKSVDEKNGAIALTYFITEEPQWQNDSDRYGGIDYIRLETTLGVPCEGAAFAGTRKDNLIAASGGYQFDGPFLKTEVSNGHHDKMTLSWYGAKNEEGKQVADTSKVLYTDEITYDIIPAYNPVPADKDRIAAIGASINHGSVAFDAVPADGTAITVSKPNEYASSYQIDGGSITSGTSANINIGDLSAGASQDYTIKWYSGENFLVGTDTLKVSARPEGYYSFAAYDTPVVIEEPVTGAQTNITPKDGFLPTASVELNYDLTKEKWEEVFYKYGEDNRIFLPLWFYLPGSAKDYFKIEYFDDESRPVEEDLNFLKDAQYFGVKLNDGNYSGNYYKYFHEGLVIAQVKYEGNNVIIEPQSGKVSWLIKWIDDKNVDHFHRVTFDVNISSSGQGIKLTNASPANDRVIFDTQDGANGSYSDGTVRYMLGEGFNYVSNTTTTTKLIHPSTDATRATVNGKEVNIVDNAIELTVEARENQSMTESFTVRWLDAGGNTIKTERITISNCPTGAGVPWQKHWAPMDSGRINVQDKNLTSFFSYDNDDGKLLFKVTDSNAGSLNADKLNELSQNELIYEITPPEGAKYFRMSGQHSPLYDSFFADSTKEWLEKQPSENCVFDENGAAKPYYYSFGKLFNRTRVEGMYVYTVNNTQVTFADMLVFQWYDENKELMKVNGKNGEYLYLIKEPYVKISETKASTETPTEKVKNPTIVVTDAKDNEILRAEIPIQKAVNPNSNTKYQYMKLKYIDKTTGLEVKPGAAGAEVYLAYPKGMTYYNFKDYTVRLTHYTDENHVKHENVTLEATLIGLKFKTDSFSPFLLEWTPKGSSSSSSSSGGSGGLSGVDITNRTNREILSYRLGGGLLTFRLAGSGDVIVTENGKVVKPDADGWYTVSAGARIVVDYPVMVLPKTGDMPVWRWLLGL